MALNILKRPSVVFETLRCHNKIITSSTCRWSAQRCVWKAPISSYPFGLKCITRSLVPAARLSHGSSQCFSTVSLRYSDMNVDEKPPGDEKSVDLVQNVDSLKQLMSLVETHGGNLDGHQITETVQLFRQLSDSAETDLALKDFTPLFDVVMRRAKFLEDRQLIACLLRLGKTGVPQNSAVMQTLLHQAENRMNDMTVNELAALGRALNVLWKTDQVTALLQAIALLSRDFVGEAISANVLTSLMVSLSTVLPKRMMAKFEDRIAAALYATKESNLARIAFVFNSFAGIGRNPEHVLDVASQLAVRSSDVHPDPWAQTLSACGELDFYNPDLLQRSVQIIDNNIDDWSYTEIARAFKAYSSLKFLNRPLLEKVANRVVTKRHENPTELTDNVDNLLTCAGLLLPYGELNFHPPPLKDFCEFIEERAWQLLPTANNAKRCGYIVDIVHTATLMGRFPVELLQFVFSQKCEEVLFKTKDKKLLKKKKEKIQSIFRAVEICCDEDTKSLLSQERSSKLLQVRNKGVITSKIDARKVLQISIKKTIESLVDDGHDVELDVDVYPDFVIDCRVMKKPSPSDTTSYCTSDKRYAVLLAPDSFYVNNLLEDEGEMWLLGNSVAKETQLKRLGDKVVWIPVREWAVLKTAEEKLEYISKKLGLARTV